MNAQIRLKWLLLWLMLLQRSTTYSTLMRQIRPPSWMSSKTLSLVLHATAPLISLQAPNLESVWGSCNKWLNAGCGLLHLHQFVAITSTISDPQEADDGPVLAVSEREHCNTAICQPVWGREICCCCVCSGAPPGCAGWALFLHSFVWRVLQVRQGILPEPGLFLSPSFFQSHSSQLQPNQSSL